MPDPQRFALVMSGAVSLGSFQAGAVAEFLYALECRRAAGHDVTLDVITGASAGSIMTALAAHVTLNRPGERDLLHKAWVQKADITALLAGAPSNALLSTDAVRALAHGLILTPFVHTGPAPYAPRVLRLGMTLANLRGHARTLGSGTGTYTSTFFDDTKRVRLAAAPDTQPPSAPNATRDATVAAVWHEIADFAIASGTFPFAFPPLELDREGWEPPWAVRPHPAKNPYVDGGLFNNQPIGEAAGLAREADEDGGAARKFLFVSAWPDVSLVDLAVGSRTPVEGVARRLLAAVFAQSRASDYFRSQLLNTQTRLRDDVLRAVGQLIAENRATDPAALIAQLQNVAAAAIGERQAAQNAAATRTPPNANLGDLLARVEKRHADKLPPPVIDGAASRHREAATLIFLVLEHMADLNERRTIDLSVVAPREDELAGEQFAAFGGFFDQNWREFNYRTGRIKARGHLAAAYGWEYPEEPGRASEYQIPDGWKGFPEARFETVDRAKREQFLEAAVERVWKVLYETEITGWAVPDWAARRAIRSHVRARLKKALEL